MADCLWKLNHPLKVGQLYLSSDVGFTVSALHRNAPTVLYVLYCTVSIPDLVEWSNALGLEQKNVALTTLKRFSAGLAGRAAAKRQSRRLSGPAEDCDENIRIGAGASSIARDCHHLVLCRPHHAHTTGFKIIMHCFVYFLHVYINYF